MRNNKFEKAFCVELNRAITPYFARELFFNKDSLYYGKILKFKCSEKCKAELYARCIYSDKRNKQFPHFAKKKSSSHSSDCKFSDEHYKVNNLEPEGTNEIGFKISNFPSVFLLEGFKTTVAGIPIIEEDINIEEKITSSKNYKGVNNRNIKSIIRTSLLDNIVDCFEKGDSKLLESEKLTIGSKTKIFKNFFKNIKFYPDEEGLIYWGVVKEFKKYGNNYSIKFKECPYINGKSFSTGIYIREDTINNFNKGKSFRKQLDALSSSNVEVRCYFVGTYPEVKTVEGKSGVFKTVDIHIDNLNHITFTFDETQTDSNDE